MYIDALWKDNNDVYLALSDRHLCITGAFRTEKEQFVVMTWGTKLASEVM